MPRYLTVFLIAASLAALGGMFWLVFYEEEGAPTWKKSWVEAELLLPDLPRGAQIDAKIYFRSKGGDSALARSFSRGVSLRAEGNVSGGSGSLRYTLRSGGGVARWKELRVGNRSFLVLGGIPYRGQKKIFLRNDWFKAFSPTPLIRIWPLLRSARSDGQVSEDFYRYPLRDFRRRDLLRSLRTPLLRDFGFFAGGGLEALVLRKSGAPGGMIFSRRLPGQKLDRLLGVSESTGINSFQVTISYKVEDWRDVLSPSLPKGVDPAGRAAFEVALLPFYVGLQGGDLNASSR